MNTYRDSFPSLLWSKVDITRKYLHDVYPSLYGFTAIINNEPLRFPYRTYFAPTKQMQNIGSIENSISLCLFTRHGNGFIRERSLVTLLAQNNIEYFMVPYILKLAEEYVLEIVKLVLSHIRDIPTTHLQQFMNENPNWLTLMNARCVSYWNFCCRHDYYYTNESRSAQREYFRNYQDYPGARIISYLLEVSKTH